MKKKILSILLVVLLIMLSGCGIGDQSDIEENPSENIDNNSENNTQEDNSNNNDTDNQNDEPLDDTNLEQEENYEETAQIFHSYLPIIGEDMYYFGLAEYGHIATLNIVSEEIDKSEYRYSGVYNDGSGIDDQFEISYILNYKDGTVTEHVISNTRNDKKEVNSKLHDLILVKLPLELGNKWSQETTINGENHTVNAEIIEYDDITGKIKVSYTVKGVSGYYNDTYFEERTFEKGYGLTGFTNLFPGEPNLSEEDKSDPQKTKEALKNLYCFGYSLNKYELDEETNNK